MKKILLYIILLPILATAQTPTQNYVLTTVFNSPVKGQFQDYSISFGSNVFKCSDGGNNGGVTGALSLVNNVLNITVSGSWASNCKLNLGYIATLDTNPIIPDMELGPLLKNGLETGYFVKIKAGDLFFYSPYYPIFVNTNIQKSYTTPITYSSVLPNIFECSSGSGGSSSNISISNNSVILSLGGAWDEFCNLKLGIIKEMVLPGGVVISNLDLGPISNMEETTVYRAKIENNKLIFYNSTTNPAPVTSVNTTINYSFQVAEDNKKQTITYYDGLGRPIETIGKRQSATKKNIVTPLAYDQYGRETKEYLPYRSSSDNLEFEAGAVANAMTFYQNPTLATTGSSNFESTAYPYKEKEFDNSPLSLLLRTSQPGLNWRLGSGHELKFSYATNAINEVRKFKISYISTDPSLHTLSINGYYNPQELYKFVTKDENWKVSDGLNNTQQEFKDKEGNVILRRNYNQGLPHDTYYVYNDVGLLCYVISPEGSYAIQQYYNSVPIPPATVPTDIIVAWCYIYKYDNQRRIIEKYIPAKGWSYTVYDKLDRPILTQDDNLKGQKWVFTKYDVMDRICYTGEYVTTVLRPELQNKVDRSSLAASEIFSTTTFTNSGIAIYYSNSAFPNASINVSTVNYYDNYKFLPVNSALIPLQVYGEKINKNAGGLLTANFTKVMGTTQWINSFIGYDKNDNKIYDNVKDNYLYYENTINNKYSFGGNIIERKSLHSKRVVESSGSNGVTYWTPTIFTDYYYFDHAERPLKHTRKFDYEDEELILYNNYNELGQVTQSKVGGKYIPDTSFANTLALQNIDYAYNIRGWLKQVNNPDDMGSDFYAAKINYDNVSNGAAPLYDGNISQILWKSNKDLLTNTTRAYNYTYDNLSRLVSGHYIKNQNGVLTSGQYDENFSYDRNGNINSLQRFGGNDSQPVEIDNLVYSYVNNYLMSVRDYSNISGFSDLNTTGNDYHYDKNGNLDSDLNKGIGSNSTPGIKYNYLNLPDQIIFNSTNSINYIYDSNGVKLKKVVTTGANVVTTEYNGGYIYQRLGTAANILQYFPHSEGYNKKTVDGTSAYIYQYRDHLGNVRLSYTDQDKNGSIQTSEIIEESNYYPFGLEHTGYNNVEFQSIGNPIAQKIKYNGKELQDELTLGLYDYGARNYDPSIGRWLNVDPLAEKSRRFSPYVYALNNPIYFIDPDGMMAKPTPLEAAIMAKHVYGDDVKLIGGWKVSNAGKGLNLNDNTTGFKSKVYERTIGGKTEYTYATAGTEDGIDTEQDVKQVFGLSEQYNQSVEVAKKLDKKLDGAELTFTGHSLGGGLAEANSIATGNSAITFNAAGLSVFSPGGTKVSNKTDAYILTTDPLNAAQGVSGLPTAGGKKHYISPGSNQGAKNGHSIDSVIESLKTPSGFGQYLKNSIMNWLYN